MYASALARVAGSIDTPRPSHEQFQLLDQHCEVRALAGGRGARHRNADGLAVAPSVWQCGVTHRTDLHHRCVQRGGRIGGRQQRPAKARRARHAVDRPGLRVGADERGRHRIEVPFAARERRLPSTRTGRRAERRSTTGICSSEGPHERRRDPVQVRTGPRAARRCFVHRVAGSACARSACRAPWHRRTPEPSTAAAQFESGNPCTRRCSRRCLAVATTGRPRSSAASLVRQLAANWPLTPQLTGMGSSPTSTADTSLIPTAAATPTTTSMAAAAPPPANTGNIDADVSTATSTGSQWPFGSGVQRLCAPRHVPPMPTGSAGCRPPLWPATSTLVPCAVSLASSTPNLR